MSAPISRPRAVTYLGLSVVSLAAGTALYARFAPRVHILRVELGGGKQTIADPPAVRKAVAWDFPFIAGYGLALLWAGLLGRPRLALPVAGIAVGADLLEDVFLLTGIPATGPTSPRLLDLARSAAIVKFAALVPAALMALAAVLRTALRLRGCRHE